MRLRGLEAADAVNEVIGGSGGIVGDDCAACGDVGVVADAAVNDGGLSEAVLLASMTGGLVAGGWALAPVACGVVAGAGDLMYLVMRLWLRPCVEACKGGFDGVCGGVAWTLLVSLGVAEDEVGEAECGLATADLRCR